MLRKQGMCFQYLKKNKMECRFQITVGQDSLIFKLGNGKLMYVSDAIGAGMGGNRTRRVEL